MVGRPLHFPEETYFSCTDCGKCCTSAWRIKVDPAKAEQIRQTQVYQHLSKEGYQPLKVIDEEFELDRAEDGSCYFLKDGLCGIHAEQGLAAKPTVCQLYPFSLVSTPDGYYVSLAFTCPAVISGSGAPAEEQRDSLWATVEAAPHFFPPDLSPGNKVTLTAESVTDFDRYQTLEKRLIDSFGDGRNLVGVILGAAASVLDGTWEGDSNQTTELVWHNLNHMLPLFLADCVASMERKARPEERAEYAQCLLYGGVVSSEVLGAVAPPYQQAAQVCQLTRSVLLRYAKSKIWGKNLLTGPTLTVRLLLLALSLELLIYYYQARKQLLGSLHFDPVILEWSFDLVESDFLLHHELVLPLMEEWERVGLEIAKA
ncbi:MAG: YkgJ family cysteine cluster protein [Candidatus Eremiobacteraeota bacterium]|nr:YkgJ family cysteine cluster protein [Candidatus Eremiobacteraeota bacterium]